ncbi:MAG: hypothetical protein J6A05_02915 [Oscillospiraceae bacterium]|nr:hypothetical protein [Oscillospiraceae bacterium]
MEKRNFDLCDVPWWEALKTDEERDKYCKEHYGISYAEYLEELEHPTVKYDPVTQEFIAI